MPEQDRSYNPRPPDYRVCVKERGDGGREGQVGSAWLNAAGYITIKLGVGAVLDWHDNLLITLFPTPKDARDA